jgi:hypothetical protein
MQPSYQWRKTGARDADNLRAHSKCPRVGSRSLYGRSATTSVFASPVFRNHLGVTALAVPYARSLRRLWAYSPVLYRLDPTAPLGHSHP